jgi:hypothetical protein
VGRFGAAGGKDDGNDSQAANDTTHVR